jgi:FAD:protein FMN transferase
MIPRLAILFLAVVAAVLPLPATAEAPAGQEAAEPSKPPASPDLKLVRRARQVSGSEAQMIAVAHGDADARRTAAHLGAAFAELDRVGALVDASVPGAELARLHAAAGEGPVLLEPELFALLLEARRLATLSGGAYDPTLAALDGVWRFEATTEGEAPAPPTDEAVEQARALVGHEGLVLDEGARTAALARAGQRVGLAGMARGWALDRAAAYLEERGVKSFLLAAGGDVVVRGTKGDEPWRVGVQDPRAPGYFASFDVDKPMAVMTSGDYERFFVVGERRCHHVLDPRTGQPAQGARSVTVFAAEGAVADALSTAVFVLGPKAGLALVERLQGVEALIVTDDNRVLHSKGLKKGLKHRPPTDAP